MPPSLEKCQVLTHNNDNKKQTLKSNMCRALVLSVFFTFSSLTPFYGNIFENENIEIL